MREDVSDRKCLSQQTGSHQRVAECSWPDPISWNTIKEEVIRRRAGWCCCRWCCRFSSNLESCDIWCHVLSFDSVCHVPLLPVWQDGHPDRLLCELQVRGQLFLLELEKNQYVWHSQSDTEIADAISTLIIIHFSLSICFFSELLPSSPSVYFYLPNGTAVASAHSIVSPWKPVNCLCVSHVIRVCVCVCLQTHCYYHGSVRGIPRARVALSTCSGLRSVASVCVSSVPLLRTLLCTSLWL